MFRGGRTPLLFAALVALAIPSPAPTASASCSYVVRTLAEWYEDASVVFVGRAIEVTEVPVTPKVGDPEGLRASERATRFLVEERFKGDLDEQVTVLAGNAWGDCIVKFDAGERYVVFAFMRKWDAVFHGDREPRGELALRTDDSSPSGRVSFRPDAVAYLRRVAAGRPPSVVGTVYDHTPQSIPEMYTITGFGRHGDTARGRIRVVLTAGDQTFSTVPGDDGAFVFDDVAPGTYSIGLELPRGVRVESQSETVPFHWVPDSEHPERVEIKAGETVGRYFTVSGSARVAGRALTPSGAPLRETHAYLVLASEAATFDAGTAEHNVRSFVGDDGAFRFDTVPPGEYVLAINSGREDAYDVGGPAFFHPGVLDPAKATRFRVTDGMTLEIGEVKAPRDPSFRGVYVEVVDANGVGREAGLLVTSGRDGREFYFHTDGSGRTRLWLRPGVPFRIEAKAWGEEESGGDAVEVPADGPLSPIRLVIPKRSQNDEAAGPVR